jgi:hypothetical protein
MAVLAVPEIDVLLDWPHGPCSVAGRCRLRVFTAGSRAVAIATDLGDENPRASVTNGAELIVEEACHRFGLDQEKTVWVEHHDDRGKESRYIVVCRGGGESFERLVFTQTRPPGGLKRLTYRRGLWGVPLRKGEVEQLIEGALP